MERVRILELKNGYFQQHGVRITQEEIADAVFVGEDISDSRQRVLISRWNNGYDLSALKPRHIKRLSKLFGVKNVEDIVTT